MHFRFRTISRAGLPGLLANAEMVFDHGDPCEGLILTGFSVWKSKKHEGQITVTFPSKPFKGKQFWLLRSPTEDQSPIYMFQAQILREYRAWLETDVPI